MKASPYILRATASGANVLGSFVYLLTENKPNAFFYLNLYASAIYFGSNIYEAYKAIKPAQEIKELKELETITVHSFQQDIISQRTKTILERG